MSNALSHAYTQGRRTGTTLAQPGDGWLQTYAYDAAGRLQTLTTPAGTFAYGYGAASSSSALVRTLALPNAAWITNHYDALARLDYTALISRWGHVLDAYAYTYAICNAYTDPNTCTVSGCNRQRDRVTGKQGDNSGQFPEHSIRRDKQL